jgi:hypothetical protein
MAGWKHLTAGLKPGERRSASADLVLTTAYRDVFAKGEQAQVVLADLANFTGFYAVETQGTPSDVLQYQAGMRAAYARIFAFLSMPDELLGALEKAARAERLADEQGTTQYDD